ncbi:MAG: hypothetical protein HKM89_03835 [Gemmatimonadales bacterium]|nr:hypothetical protein [Gemmatimonadales bacterium]
MRYAHVLTLGLTGMALMACAHRTQAQADTTRDAVSDGGVEGNLPPAGYGTLEQSRLAVTIRTDELEIRFVPLDERVTRLLAPDAYRSLHELVASRRAGIDSLGIPDPGLMLVTFFSKRPDVLFDAQLISIEVRSRRYRPIGVIPYSSNFTSGQLGTREQATGIIVFDSELAVYEPMTFAYDLLTTNGWERNLGAIERERSRVTLRAQQAAEERR